MIPANSSQPAGATKISKMQAIYHQYGGTYAPQYTIATLFQAANRGER